MPLPGRGKKADQNKKATINLSGKVSKQDGVKSTLTIDSDDGRNIEFRISSDTKITGQSGKLSAADLHLGDELTIQAHTDDKGFFPAYAMTPVVRKETLDKNPKLAELLNGLSAKLDDATMAKLNATVDVEKKTIEDVAGTFLKSQGLI